MKLAFSGQARYPEFEEGYRLYKSRNRSREPLDEKTYRRVVREYCKLLRRDLLADGMVDLPSIGSLYATIFRRRPQYRGDKFVGYGKMDWEKGHYDGEPTAFGISFLPKRNKTSNLRSFGFVANRRLFQEMKALYQSYDCPWTPMEFDKEII